MQSPPKATTVTGTPENIYVNGYIYPSGSPSLGSSCASPLLEIRNATGAPITICYASRVAIGCDVLESQQVIPAKGYCLVLNMYPSLMDELSKIRVEDCHGQMESFVLGHNAQEGYTITRLHEVEGGRPVCENLDLRPRSDPYSMQFCGCNTPKWGNAVLVPLVISCS